MTTTKGTNQGYERLMRKALTNKRGRSGQSSARFIFADLDCRGCMEKKDCQGECLCPHILGNLPDLVLDSKFLQAVKNAESCKTPHKETLLFLLHNKKMLEKRTVRFVLADFDCRSCLEAEECQGECLCPRILGHLPDLSLDTEFLKAVKNAANCKTPQKETLLFVLHNQKEMGR